MADISQYLQDILDAVYGEQVRGSIHDAIEIINDVSEVVISAGTAVTSASSSSTGFFQDSLYINTDTCDLWECLGTDSWQKIGNLRGIGITSITKTSTSGNVDTYTIAYSDGTSTTFNVTNGIDGTNGSTWYKGTALSGTGSGITGFPGVINDFYLNSTTGGVYVCTKTGAAMVPDAAEWDYVMTLSGGGGGGSILVIDNLTSSSSTDALSANQGRILNNKVADKANTADLANVATSGDYDDLSNKPDLSVYAKKTEIFTVIENKNIPSTPAMAIYDSAITADSIIIPCCNKNVKYTSMTASTGELVINFANTWTGTADFSILVKN